MIKTKRTYESVFRILVDRLWPRGVKKEVAEIVLLLKETAPFNDLRKWFAHDPEKWAEFRKKYAKELAAKQGLLNDLRRIERERRSHSSLFSERQGAQRRRDIEDNP